jgi:hypothetical protein
MCARTTWIPALEHNSHLTQSHVFHRCSRQHGSIIGDLPLEIYSNITVMDIHGWDHLGEISFHRHELAVRNYNTWISTPQTKMNYAFQNVMDVVKAILTLQGRTKTVSMQLLKNINI